MKKLLTSAIALLCATTATCSEKVYITPDQIHVEQSNILIDFQGTLYSVNGLYRDDQGLHVSAKDVIDQHSFSYTCPYGHSSPDGSGMCSDPICLFRKKR